MGPWLFKMQLEPLAWNMCIDDGPQRLLQGWCLSAVSSQEEVNERGQRHRDGGEECGEQHLHIGHAQLSDLAKKNRMTK